MNKIWTILLCITMLIGCSTAYSGDSESGKSVKKYELDYLPNGDYIIVSSGSGGSDNVYFKLKSNKRIEESVPSKNCYFNYIDGKSYVEIKGKGYSAKHTFYINLNK